MAGCDQTSLDTALSSLSFQGADAHVGPASSAGPADRSAGVAAADLVFINARGSRVGVSRDVLAKIPFLDTLFSARIPSQQDEEGIFVLDLDPLVLPAIFKYVTSGHSQYLLSALPSGVCDAGTVFQTLDYLCVDMALKSSLYDICERLSSSGIRTHDGREAARDAAAELLLGLSSGAFDTRDRRLVQRLFQRVLFIVSHPRTFYRRIRRWAHQMGLEHIPGLSRRQLQLLQEWRDKGDTHDDGDSCTGSSSSSSSCDYNSDDYYD